MANEMTSANDASHEDADGRSALWCAAQLRSGRTERDEPGDGDRHGQRHPQSCRGDHHDEDRHDRADDEAECRHDGCLTRIREDLGIEAELVASVHLQTIELRELVSHLLGERFAEPSLTVDAGELVAFGLGIGSPTRFARARGRPARCLVANSPRRTRPPPSTTRLR